MYGCRFISITANLVGSAYQKKHDEMKKLLHLILLLMVVSPWQLHAQSQDSVSLDQMIGQMVMVGLNKYDDPSQKAATQEAIKQGKISGVILFEKDLEPKNTKKKLAKLVWELQENAPVPLFIGIDEEGGKVTRLKTKYGFSKTVTAEYLGKLDNLDSTRFYASATAKNLSDFGFNVNYAPTVDVDLNPDNPVIGKYGRSYSDDYRQVIQQAQVVIQSHDQYQVATVLKHFPGHGSSASDTHLGIADVSLTWQFEEIYPYSVLMDSGLVKAVMTSHIINRTLDDRMLPATLSDKIINGILRNHLGFKGVVFSDDMHMGAITQHFGFEDAVILAINAGVDVLMFSNNITLKDETEAEDLHSFIKKAVEEGKIKEETIRRAYVRIMTLKKELGLLDKSYLMELQQKLKMN
jgi:beta-N-acetylhexosaminidase